MSVYKERTHLNPWFRWGAVVLISGFMIFSILSMTVLKTESGNDELFAMLISILGGLIGITIAVIIRLDLRLGRDSIQYRMFPLEWKTRKIDLKDVESMKIIKINLFRSGYGGFGRRRKPWKKEVAYILNRKAGLHIRLKNGKSRIFSMAQEAKLRQFLRANYSEQLNERNYEKV